MISTSPISSPLRSPSLAAAKRALWRSQDSPADPLGWGKRIFGAHRSFPRGAPSYLTLQHPFATHTRAYSSLWSVRRRTKTHTVVSKSKTRKNLPVVKVSPDERVAVNDKQRRRYTGKQRFEESLSFDACLWWNLRVDVWRWKFKSKAKDIY